MGEQVIRIVGIRYAASALRALVVERTQDGHAIVGAAVIPPNGDVAAALAPFGCVPGETPVVYGLRPGDFLSSLLKRGDGMDDEAVTEHLVWEIERKMVSPSKEYAEATLMSGDMGIAFAARRAVVERVGEVFGAGEVQVEPVALLNGCEAAGELGDGPVAIMAADSGGVSSLVVADGAVLGVDSFTFGDGDLADLLDRMSIRESCENVTEIAGRVAETLIESLDRISSHGHDKEKTEVNRILLAGLGACADELVEAVGRQSGLPVTVSKPFGRAARVDGMTDFEGLDAAFTMCLGLAMQADAG